ncbi:MAG: phosphoenolpyruvate carboxykinase (GTP) [Candidatus Heimdallarchaeota archaeon]
MEAYDQESAQKLQVIPSKKIRQEIFNAMELCNPDSLFVCSDDPEDIEYIRKMAIETGEESPLRIEGHTIHFDGEEDQARDTIQTKYLVPEGDSLGANLNQTDREHGLEEIRGFFKDCMKGKQMIVRFFCLGPANSPFSILCMQITDSFYVAHSEDLLYRSAYEQFKTVDDSEDIFFVLHSAGRLEKSMSVETDKRRIYIDYTSKTVLSVNTQYAGNTVGFKKLALRLAIRKADQEGWLAEHDFMRNQYGPNGRETTFLGAFPSACGKTSTAMAPGGAIIGDDLAYLKIKDGVVRAVNVENGIFGIIRDVNKTDDPFIWDALTSPGEVIFSNVLVAYGTPYWQGDGRETPDKGVNFTGKWYKGKKNKDGGNIPHAHSNARYTIRMADLSNRDSRVDNPDGVLVDAIIYGGRDSDTSVPVVQSFNWRHGVITMAASLESETTSATLGQEGVRKFQPMSNIDFVSIPLGKYIKNHLNFVKNIENPPLIFGVNYFLKDEGGNHLNGMHDKQIWLSWMERRTHGDVLVIDTPIGLIPQYEDLKTLFREILDKEYSRGQYEQQFAIRIPELLAKIERIESIYRNNVSDTPKTVFKELDEQKHRLLKAKAFYGDYIMPGQYTR